MSILPTSSRWPLYLAITGLVIVVASVWYTNNLASKLAKVEQHFVDLYKQSVKDLGEITSEEELDRDVTFQGEIIQQMESVPRIITNFDGKVVDWAGFGSRDNSERGNRYEDSMYIQRVVEEWIEEGQEPAKLYAQLQYFGESRLLRQLRYFPLIQAILIGTFVFLGYLGINQTRKAEQNRVWVGMAKETAHQLGTPISAIMGWVEHLKLMYADDEDLMEVSDELGRDVERLSMVANRFSKIGATPELEPVNIFEELNKCREYMEKRAPRKVSFNFPAPNSGDIKAAINPLLFDWVFENLLRNALDAMDGKGVISGSIRELEDKVYIDITDTGKGIAPKNVRKVFNPGFTTKKRGWGLGLSLVKRIVEEYHKGKIVVSHSEVGKGTTFTITLPRA
ncbi:sensor histidine kinase [Neolewinella persica]|uniref:sensor histidine kinase n=1 Tax=Neolewinella persica TaxID=70998 RepID=UPI00047818A0|nr:HAMP domain-containing sensor histidine kinase [Neolewinella persica]